MYIRCSACRRGNDAPRAAATTRWRLLRKHEPFPEQPAAPLTFGARAEVADPGGQRVRTPIVSRITAARADGQNVLAHITASAASRGPFVRDHASREAKRANRGRLQEHRAPNAPAAQGDRTRQLVIRLRSHRITRRRIKES